MKRVGKTSEDQLREGFPAFYKQWFALVAAALSVAPVLLAPFREMPRFQCQEVEVAATPALLNTFLTSYLFFVQPAVSYSFIRFGRPGPKLRRRAWTIPLVFFATGFGALQLYLNRLKQAVNALASVLDGDPLRVASCDQIPSTLLLGLYLVAWMLLQAAFLSIAIGMYAKRIADDQRSPTDKQHLGTPPF